jgi:hypothetical protein
MGISVVMVDLSITQEVALGLARTELIHQTLLMGGLGNLMLLLAFPITGVAEEAVLPTVLAPEEMEAMAEVAEVLSVLPQEVLALMLGLLEVEESTMLKQILPVEMVEQTLVVEVVEVLTTQPVLKVVTVVLV